MINPMTQHVRKLLWQALYKRFYDQYHTINAMKYSNMFNRTRMISGKVVGYLDCSSFYVDNVKFSYVINM